MHEIKPIDHEAIREKISMIDSYWDRQPTDQPWTVNGFNGTWNFSDHDLIPDALRNFITESFPKIERFKRIPLEEINKLMNDVWEGPGSMPKIVALYNKMKQDRLNNPSADTKDYGEVKTLDDYGDEEITKFRNDEE